MMFNVQTEVFGEFKQIKLENVKSGEFVIVVPDYGGCVNELVLSKAEEKYSVINGCATYNEMIENKSYKSAKMLPFANRIPDGRYEFGGKNYQLPINWPRQNHAIHGFMHDKKYKIADKMTTRNYAKLTLEHQYDGKYPGYPFPFHVALRFQLSKEGFTYSTEIKNIGKSSLPIMDGWHPYFSFNGKNLNALFLKISVRQRTEIDNRMIPTGKLWPFENFVKLTEIKDTFFDTCFPLDSKKAIHSTELFDAQKNVTLQFWQETGFKKYNFLQIYTPPERNSIAIEPMTSNCNSFNSGDGLIILNPGEKFLASCGVKL